MGRRAILGVMCVAIVLLFSHDSHGWSSTGHKVVASICYRQLTPAQRVAVVEVLKAHPRYQEDFADKMPAAVREGSADAQAEWLFQQAAIWPDMSRSGPADRRQYHRSKWHYINVPHFLSEDARDALGEDLDVNLKTDPPSNDFDHRDMNVVQAILNSDRIIQSVEQPDSVKAVHLCWLLHCIGDLHQPLHSTALFSQNLFPGGDRGGNSVKTQKLSNLHSAWDRAFGSDSSPSKPINIAIELLAEANAADLISLARSNLQPEVWRNESHEVAIEHAYDHQVVSLLQDLEEADDDIGHNPIPLTDDYLSKLRMVANRQVVLAGVRCASVLAGLRSEGEQESVASSEEGAFEPIVIATWNVAQIDREVSDLDIDGFLEEVDFDILLVDEIKTQNDLDSLKAAMDREEFFTAISSFENGNGNLEVGIISRFPLTDIVEFDRSLDNFGTSIEERLLERVNLPGIADVGVGRGFLVAKVPMLNTYVIVSHLKSSRGASGPSDFSNAQKRELVAAAIATHVLELLEDDPECTVIFGGDVNVGVADASKNGVILEEDHTGDGYDDTHALLGGGLIDGLSMRSLAKNVSGTYVGDDDIEDFPGTGAIDVLYVTGAMADLFHDAVAASTRYGSDHLAVFATTGMAVAEDDDSPMPEAERIEITNALPNPEGIDNGNEQVTITHGGSGTVDISGWSMRDRAGNIYEFPAGTKLSEGDNEITLLENTMPLNNSGDTIMLLDDTGLQRGQLFQYSGEEVVPGMHVR